MSFASLLDNSITIKRKSKAGDSMGGGGVVTWTTIYSNVPCCYETLEKKVEIQAYDKKTVYPDLYIYLEWKSGIKEGDSGFKGDRQFEIKLIENTKEMDEMMKLSVVELTRNE